MAVFKASLDFHTVCGWRTREQRVACGKGLSSLFFSALCRAEATWIQEKLGAHAEGPSAFPKAVRLRGSGLVAEHKRHCKAFSGTGARLAHLLLFVPWSFRRCFSLLDS